MKPGYQSMFRQLFTDTREQFEAHAKQLAVKHGWPAAGWELAGSLPAKCDRLANLAIHCRGDGCTVAGGAVRPTPRQWVISL